MTPLSKTHGRHEAVRLKRLKLALASQQLFTSMEQTGFRCAKALHAKEVLLTANPKGVHRQWLTLPNTLLLWEVFGVRHIRLHVWATLECCTRVRGPSPGKDRAWPSPGIAAPPPSQNLHTCAAFTRSDIAPYRTNSSCLPTTTQLPETSRNESAKI